MNRPIRNPWVKACAANHLQHLIERLKPPIVVAMGVEGWLAARLALEIRNAPKNVGGVAGSMWTAPKGIKVFPVGHCGRLGQVSRPLKQQRDDWKRIGIEVSISRRA